MRTLSRVQKTRWLFELENIPKSGRGEPLTVGKTRSSLLCLLAVQNTCVSALKRVFHLVRVRTTDDEPAPTPRNADARTPSINVCLHMHL